MVNGGRTCGEGTPKFGTTVHNGKNGVFRQPVLVAVHLVVPISKQLHLDAGKHRLDAIERGVCDAQRGHEPAENRRIAHGNSPRRKRPRWLVQLVFLWRFDLVRKVKLQDVYPNPKDGGQDIYRAAQWCRGDRKQCLVGYEVSRVTGTSAPYLPPE